MTDNELIALFDGWKKHPNWEGFVCEPPKHLGKLNWNYSHDELRYTTSWDWLMPVVEKIERLGWIVTILKNYSEIFSEEHPFVETSFATASKTVDKITLLHKTIVEFIKWHNTQKQ